MKKIIIYACLIAWIALIFILSSQVATQSNNLSTGVTAIVNKIVNFVTPNSSLSSNITNRIVRKSAHFMAYLVLGVLVIFSLQLSGLKQGKSFVLALIICISLAIADEIHQSFVPGRGCQVYDVFIDGCGAFVGITLQSLWAFLVKQ